MERGRYNAVRQVGKLLASKNSKLVMQQTFGRVGNVRMCDGRELGIGNREGVVGVDWDSTGMGLDRGCGVNRGGCRRIPLPYLE